MIILGISKTLYNSGITVFSCLDDGNLKFCEVILTERITRKKSSKSWPHKALSFFENNYYKDKNFYLLENRDVMHPAIYEQVLSAIVPFDDQLESMRMAKYLSKSDKVEYVGHHMAHAYSAVAFSPVRKAIILVIDGAGSLKSDLPESELPKELLKSDMDTNKKLFEEYSIFTYEDNLVTCVEKKWQEFISLAGYRKKISWGIGIAYEVVADFIFGNNLAAGKVMGLAAYGTPLNYNSVQDFLTSLDWSKAFKGNGKQEWEASPHMSLYQDIAATIQFLYEEKLNGIIERISKAYPEFDTCIIAGGSALNVISNYKLYKNKFFKKIFIPPAPDDRGISIGLAMKKYCELGGENNLTNFQYKYQKSSFGMLNSIPCMSEITYEFSDYSIIKCDNLEEEVSKRLNAGEVIALFNGQSEVGPRSLGNRSIIANPLRSDLKDYLNKNIKFRESFRPYGATCLFDKKDIYFDIDIDMECPYMSFSVPVRTEYREKMQSIVHIDGTCRIQTLRLEQNEIFYKIIKAFGNKSGVYCVLNTSLNIMGEPIIETIHDLRKFLDQSVITSAVVNNVLITKIM